MSSKTAYFTAKTTIVGILALTLVTIPLLGDGEEYGQTGIHTTSTCSETGADSDNSEAAISTEKWTKSRLSGSPEPAAPYEVIRVYENLNFINPVIITGGPDNRLYVATQKGKIYSFKESCSACDAPDLIFDVKELIDAENAIYGLAFDPSFEDNRLVYICYVAKGNADNGTHVSRFRLSEGDVPRIDPQTEEILIQWRSGGHNGGCMKFGNDGYLYITTGDASPPSPPDQHNTGQGVDDLLSCVLRIDVSQKPTADQLAYAIPEDNPFVDTPDARGEIWAFGFRNPWKISFDRDTGKLWLGDVGWELWEMIYDVQRGGNYGWSVTEGPQAVQSSATPGPTPILPPAVSHHHSESRSITGGYVYRGSQLDGLVGHYIYGDYVTGKLWALPTASKTPDVRATEIAQSSLRVICFGETTGKELLVMDYAGGIYQLQPNENAGATTDFPTKLSQTGLFNPDDLTQPAPGVRSYQVAQPQWMDGLSSSRFVGIPDGGSWTVNPKNGALTPADGTVLAKTVYNVKPNQPIETQVLLYQGSEWHAYSYLWNEKGTDAQLVGSDGNLVAVENGSATLNWRINSRSECLACHNTRTNQVIGFRTEQLNAGEDNQLHSLIRSGHIRIAGDNLNEAEAFNPENLQPSLPAMAASTATIETPEQLELQIRSYLASNCSNCHQVGGGGTATIDLRFQLEPNAMKMIQARPTQGSFSIPDARIISPGDPLGSVMLYRLLTVGRGHMPHLGAKTPDTSFVHSLSRWIESLESLDDSEATPQVQASVLEQREDLQMNLKAESLNGDNGSAIVEQSLGSTPASIGIALAASSDANTKLHKYIAEKVTDQADAHITGLFELHLPPGAIPERLGDRINPQTILAIKGDVARGRDLFAVAEGVQCRNCHKIGDAGKALGPDLAALKSKQSKAEILDSILYPSRRIDAKYAYYVIETTEGRVLSGMVKDQTDEHVTIVDPKGEVQKLAKESVDRMERQNQSLMPELLVKNLTAQQLADLLEFLTN